MTANEAGTTSVEQIAELPFDGVRVLDLTNRVGNYCGKLLADVGADVIKIELPSGDALRYKPPFREGVPRGESSLLFAYLNNNKRGITLDWTNVETIPVLARLAATADVVLVSPEPSRPLVGFQESEPHLTWLPDQVLLCAITPFGLTGPLRHWRATPFTSFAASGEMYPNGPSEGPPRAMPGQQLYDDASVHAALVVEAALATRDRFPSQTIDIAAHNVGTWQHLTITRYGQIGRIIDRATNFGPPPGGVWQCRNGVVDIAAHALHHWDIFVELIGSPEELTDEMYKDRGIRIQLFDMLTTMIEAHMRGQDAQEFVERGQAAGLPCAMMYRPDEFLGDVQPRARGTFVTVDHPALGEITIPGPSVHSSAPLAKYRRPAPTLGQSNVEVYVDELGFNASVVGEWSTRGLI